jgi:hypothetical protein
MTTNNEKNHYVDNKKLQQAMIEYKASVVAAEQEGRPKPIVPNYIGKSILLISQRLSLMPNFVNYPYREEMVSDGVENCIKYIDNFDPTKYDKPFAYFTQIIYYAFLRRILKEKKQLYVKHKLLENSLITNTLMEQGEFDELEVVPTYINMENENTSEFITNFEDNLEKKRKKRKQQGVELFLEKDEGANEQ